MAGRSGETGSAAIGGSAESAGFPQPQSSEAARMKLSSGRIGGKDNGVIAPLLGRVGFEFRPDSNSFCASEHTDQDVHDRDENAQQNSVVREQ